VTQTPSPRGTRLRRLTLDAADLQTQAVRTDLQVATISDAVPAGGLLLPERDAIVALW
jgi:hypothetical protein